MSVCKKDFVLGIMKYLSKQGGFTVAPEMKVVSATEKIIQTEFVVTEDLANTNGTLHGGATATIVDNVSSMGLLCAPQQKSGVSVNMSINYLKGAKIGETVVVESVTQKVGRTLAYCNVTLKNKATGDLIATGTHVKHIGSPKP